MSFRQTAMSVNAFNEMISKKSGKNKKSPNKTMSEDTLQKMVARFLETKYPNALWFHSPNGGKRNAAEAAKFKAMGVKSGVPDIMILTPSSGFSGFAIELKVGSNKPTDNQNKWLNELRDINWHALVCRSYEEAIFMIDKYFENF